MAVDAIRSGIDPTRLRRSVAVEIDGVAFEDGGHELRAAEGPRPRALELIGGDVAVVENLQHRQELILEIVLTPADAGERGGRADERTLAGDRPELGLDAPDRRHHVAVDPVGVLDGVEGRLVLRQEFAAARNAFLGNQEVEVLPQRFLELRLRIEQVHDAQIGRQPRRVPVKTLARDAATRGGRP